MKTMFKAVIVCTSVLTTVLTITATPSAIAQDAQGAESLYQDLGGIDGIKKVVAGMISIVGSDTRIKHQFDDIDMKHLEKMLDDQFCVVSGGPCKYTGKDMHTIHADLGVTDAQFNALVEDLQTAMDKQGIAPSVQNKLVGRLAPMHRDIVTK